MTKALPDNQAARSPARHDAKTKNGSDLTARPSSLLFSLCRSRHVYTAQKGHSRTPKNVNSIRDALAKQRTMPMISTAPAPTLALTKSPSVYVTSVRSGQ